jgi:hypothetical protein
VTGPSIPWQLSAGSHRYPELHQQEPDRGEEYEVFRSKGIVASPITTNAKRRMNVISLFSRKYFTSRLNI